MAHIVRGTDFRLFEVKDQFLVGLGILQHFQSHYWCVNLISAICTHTGINHAYPSVSADIDFFFIFRHTHWPNYTQHWQKKGIIIHHYVKQQKLIYP